MNNKIKIIVENDPTKFINYLIYHNIKYDKFCIKDNRCTLIIDYSDYKTISRRFKTKIIKYYGIKNYKEIFINNKYMLISLIFGLFVLKLLTITIFNIEINTNDKELKDKLINILKEKDISIHKKKKSFKEIEKIKNEILKENSDLLEWIEIEGKGTKYIVNVTQKVKNNTEINNVPCDIVASKSGTIKHIVVYSGTKIKEENEYVNKGEKIIDRSIMKGDKLISEVPSKGEVYAEVWYKVKLEIPLNYKEKKIEKVFNHYYIEIFNKNLSILGKLDKGEIIDKKVFIDKPYLPFKIYKEIKEVYNYSDVELSEEEAYKKAYKEIDDYFKEKLSTDENITTKKVLKKSIKSSKMYLEVFVKTYENIALIKEEKEILNESSNN